MVEALVIKIFYLVIAIFSVTLAFLFSSDPYYAEQFKRNLQVSNTQATNFTDYEINASKVAAIYKANEINRYDKFDEAKGFSATILRGAQTHFLSSDSALMKANEVKFTGKAHYENNESLKFSSDEIIYNTQSKIVRSDVPFVMTQGSDRANGSSISYDTTKQQIKAKDIKAWVEQER